MVRRNYARRVGACIACLVLTINLVCTSYTRVEAAPVAGYAIEEVVAALLVSLGITGATGEALDKAGLTGTDATKILNSIYAGAKEFSKDTDEMIDRTIMGAIADATETGKIIFKEGSKAWDALKDWAKTAYGNIKELTNSATSGVVLSGTYPTQEEWEALYKQLVSSFYGVSESSVSIPNDYAHGGVYWDFGGACYYVVVVSYGLQLAYYAVHENTYNWEGQDYWYNQFNSIIGKHYLGAYGYDIFPDGSVKDRAEWHSSVGGAVTNEPADPVSGVQIVWSNVCYPWQRWLGDTVIPSVAQPLPWSNAYDRVYNPAVDEFLDIATPTNTITREKDGTRTVAGDRTIDVARPIAYPIDLTKGIVIGKDIPIDDVLDRTKTDEKTDGKDDNKKDENKPPITPDLPSGAVGDNLEADLKSIFPFCIPFDLIACIKGLAAEPEAPVWNIKIPMPTNYTWTITIDMSDYEGVVRIFRIGEDLLFIVGLIVVTRNLIRG